MTLPPCYYRVDMLGDFADPYKLTDLGLQLSREQALACKERKNMKISEPPGVSRPSKQRPPA
jgi:hypothetical protein